MALDLEAIGAEFLNQCPPCDHGLLKPCTCASRDYRPTMLDLVREVTRLRTAMLDMSCLLDGYADRSDEFTAAQNMRSAASGLRLEVAR
jgi:hypothetical protein